jgi:hypothetical protein
LLAVFSNISIGEVFGKLSSDDGLNWSSAFSVKSSGTDYSAFSGPLLIDGNRTFLFYLRWVSSVNCSVWMLESMDNAQTWQNDRQIDGGRHGYVNLGTNALRMRNGTLILPIAWDGDASILRSDDGLNWTEGESIPKLNFTLTEDGILYRQVQIDEPAIVELSNSSLYVLLRTYNIYGESVHFYSLSNDYGMTWSVCEPVEGMLSFNTTPALFRYLWNPNIVIAAWINRTISAETTERRPLVVAYSLDDCNTWKGVTVIDSGFLNDSINEPNIVQSNGYILVGYRRYLDSEYGHGIFLFDSLIRRFALGFLADRDSMIQAFGLTSDDLNWNPVEDINHDGVVNILDAILLANRTS